jgi:murein DD-endopeptidase MepM/ murein hydrolase activator NlpD
VADGTVVRVIRRPEGDEGTWGNVVTVAHAGDMASWYAHLGDIYVTEGAVVRKGQPVGAVGTTGAVSRATLAFRLMQGQRPVDPVKLLP